MSLPSGQPEVRARGCDQPTGAEFGRRPISVGVAEQRGQMRQCRQIAAEGDGVLKGVTGGVAQPGHELSHQVGTPRGR